MGKKVLVVGGGGREHAIVKALKRSPKVEKIYCAPGNAGIAQDAECVDIAVENAEALVNFAQRHEIDMSVIGPEAALAAGVADAMLQSGLKVFGPTKAATRIESSKEFAKEIMAEAGVPTASYESFDDFAKALEYVKGRPLPAVIKYDGLAAGKGVVIAATYEEAEEALKDMLLDESFGKGKVVIEDFLEGPEFSFMCMVSGDKVYPLEVAQDHKRAFDGDKGPNTGGMGAYSPVPFITEEIKERALNEIMKPVAATMVKRGIPFTGVLYGGLILTKDGPQVIEFNARFGDPETEVVLPRLESDFYELIDAVTEGKDFPIEWSRDACLGIVLASEGYPGKYEKGHEIKGLEDVGTEVYHMGTKLEDGKFKTAGGRVLMVTGRGDNLAEANERAREEIKMIECESLFHRTDIGKAALTRVISGTKLAKEVKNEVAEKVKEVVKEYGRPPHLVVILVGEDPASQSYVKGKGKDAEEVGFKSTTLRFPDLISEKDLLDKIQELNEDEEVDGILVQLPLPRHIDEDKVIETIDKEKDVDGFHPANVAALWQKQPCTLPCTPKGIIRMLDEAGVEIEGKRAVVIGRSNIVGLPVSKLLLDRNATVTIAHSRTKNLPEVASEADILVVAIGRPKFVTADFVKEGAAVIDVGVNRNPETGKLCGDVDYEACKPKASVITPVPGGVGPMTRACLMENTLECFQRKMEKKQKKG